MKKNIFTFLTLFLFCYISSFAATFTYTGTGNWTDAGNWDTYPGTTINAGDIAIIDGECTILAFTTTVTNNGTIRITAGNKLVSDHILQNNSLIEVYGNLETGSTIANNSGATIDIFVGGLAFTSGTNFVNLAGATINNAGTFQNNFIFNSGGSFNNNAGGALNNNGTINNENGAVLNNAGGTVTSNNFSNMPGARLTIGSDFTTNGAFANDGILTGNGTLTVNGTFTNNPGSIIRPGAGDGSGTGTLTITGNFDFGNAEYEATINGDSDFDVVAVSGTATVGVNSELSATFGYSPDPDQTFGLITAGTMTGNYDPTNVSFSGGGVTTLETNNAGTGLNSVANPSPAPVPTLGQWGLIVLALLLVNFAFVMLTAPKLVTTTGQQMSTFNLKNLPFDMNAYGKIWAATAVGILAIFTVAIQLFGYELTSADPFGAFVSSFLVAYAFFTLKNEE